MKQKFDYNVNGTMIVVDEAIKGIVIDFGAVVTGGATVSAIANLNDISIDILISRANGTKEDFFSGYLDDLLNALYSQSPSLEIVKTAFGKTYKIYLKFLGGTLILGNGDKMTINMKALSSAFTSLDTGESLSYINIETMPSSGVASPIPMIKSHGVGNGEINVDMHIGNGVHKIIAAMDFGATYTASSKAKFEGVTIEADGYTRSLSTENLIAENRDYFDDNPESTVAQLVLYWEATAINNVRVKGKLTEAADNEARILVVSMSNYY